MMRGGSYLDFSWSFRRNIPKEVRYTISQHEFLNTIIINEAQDFFKFRYTRDVIYM